MSKWPAMRSVDVSVRMRDECDLEIRGPRRCGRGAEVSEAEEQESHVPEVPELREVRRSDVERVPDVLREGRVGRNLEVQVLAGGVGAEHAVVHMLDGVLDVRREAVDRVEADREVRRRSV